jgi:hypothetical protein
MDDPRLHQGFQAILTVVIAASLVSLAAAQEVSWSIPEDGGTPRRKDRIERIGANEFRIQASFEEGGQSVSNRGSRGQHLADLRFFPMVPRCWTLRM